MILYVIGNGFDLHHGLKTRYYDFAEYLMNNSRDSYDLLEDYISFPLEDGSLWARFEENLANLDIDRILDDNSIYLPDISSDDFRSRDLNSFPYTMHNICESLTTDLVENFQNFIQQVQFPNSAYQRMIELKKGAKFLSFNYTNTLEKLYNIERNKILYIHNSAFYGGEDIILGHGIEPNSFVDNQQIPEDLTEEELELWYEQQSNNYDYSFDTGKENLINYFTRTYKPSKEIIKKNQNFFSSLNEIDEIFVFGHSLSNVDLPYFEEIVKNTKENINWIISYYSSKELSSHEKAMKSINVENFEFIKLDDILINHKQLKFEF